jgi:hypothetical protein
VRKPKKPCEWCLNALVACSELSPVLPATHTVKWPEIRIWRDGVIPAERFQVCGDHARPRYQPHEAKAYRFRRLS